jgi:ABC-2 type transport system ATP-binding protein
MSILGVHDIVKQFKDFRAVDHLTFQVERGEIFGLLGPNGAGKTTTIRMVMDILKPDEGEIQILGGLPGQARERIGYLPEERGLYRDQAVLSVLIYLGELKGADRSVVRRRAYEWLERTDLAEWAQHKVRDLSRGMQQKVQLIASMVHDPELLILDEPFQGLDPVNVGSVIEIIRALQSEGKTIVLSAHEMNRVEALCDRIALINQGQAVLYGDLKDIKRRYSPDAVRLSTSASLESLPGVREIQHISDNTYNLVLDPATTPQKLLQTLVEGHIPVEKFEVGLLPLEEIFVRVVKEASHA